MSNKQGKVYPFISTNNSMSSSVSETLKMKHTHFEKNTKAEQDF